MAAYTRRLRCAGAPRRPASGSGLSLTIPAWHAVLYDPEEFEHRHGPVLRCRHGLRRDLSGSALPKFPQSASRGARLSRLPGLLTLRPARLLALLRRIEPASRPQRAFTSRLPAVWSPALPLDMTTTWTGLLVLAGLSPAGMAASLAAPDPDVNLSAHPAPTVRPLPDTAIANARTAQAPDALRPGPSAAHAEHALSGVDISTSPSMPGVYRDALALGKVPICDTGHSS